MADVNDEAAFTFSWLALKLLGRGLYSNPWSALSELVANGLDAGATEVHVYVNTADKSNATVEVIDNGSGMSRSDIANYVKVGRDKRRAAEEAGLPADRAMGRKGIGKLAALFLSPHFYLATRHVEGESRWELNASDADAIPDENPRLVAVAATPPTANDSLWAGLESGTRLTMLGVDLTGYGVGAIDALGTRLANQFLLPNSESPQVLLWVQTSTDSRPQYVRVEKSIAFNNLSEVLTNFPDSSRRPRDLEGTPPELLMPARGLPGDVYLHSQARNGLAIVPNEDEAWGEVSDAVDLESRTYEGVQFALTGWIGVHSTIDTVPARANDERFTKNRYYNPAQIRVYVRDKLASDRLLSQLGLTGTYANYIEGEIAFDLLDDDNLPDIATSNRQDFDETDKRVVLLRALVRPLVMRLIQNRNELASVIGAKVKREKERRETASKRHFAEQLQTDLDQHHELAEAARDELRMVITNKVQGDVTPKQSYRVFLSHAHRDRSFVALIDQLLQARGARPDEIFFTSRSGSVDVLLDVNALSEVVRRNIVNDNTLIFYMTSKNFLASQFCLFEGGAGWATRAVSEYLKLNVDYPSIPSWLTNGRGEAVLLADDGSISLTPEIHNYLIAGVLNPMIDHLNRGRDIAAETTIPRFETVDFPSAVDMSRAGTRARDYYDRNIAEHWDAVVKEGLEQYVSSYLTPSE